ncbi:MAG: hypothetical protein DCC43_02005 [Candidatus Brocadia sp.]|nr:hypothetical protein [Candidatus Brocadia fulgida]MCC6325755.1 hypothetical protein [Candidatus Brocadia sp.]MCE7910829.1 hypothetical protein [Candidatus Brocadia sp. AMX3]MDG5996772.1 hypothetical protein [Candidatus Brocadia sp.]RIK02782.1 MAG: hypothetical protein DCC43_02005 [Candidatus Brocadia sp.]
MRIPGEEANLFYKLIWGLQFYVNQQHQILPNIKSANEYAELPMSEKLEVRDALWKNPNLIDVYVEKNPDSLSTQELDIVSKWKRFVAGGFQIFRYLKNYTIFINENSQVYGVLGLYDNLEDLFPGRPLPMMVAAVLLPFKGKIVYDGVLKGYNISFGGSIRSGLNEKYMAAKQNDRIITTLEPEAAPPIQARHQQKPGKDWKPVVEEIVRASEKMRGSSPVQNAAFALLRDSARTAQLVVQQPDDLEEIWRLKEQVQKALNQLQRVLERAEQ